MASKETITAEAQELLNRLQEAIVGCDQEEAEKVAQEAVQVGLDPMVVIDRAVSGAAKIVGKKFDGGEYALPQLILSADAMTAASEVLEASLPQGRLATRKVVVIGTVQGDLHTVGKSIVAMMLQAGGFDVHDLGVDVRSSTFVNRARELKAEIVALSSLMTTTLPYQRDLIETLEAMGLRDQFKVMVGGGPVTKTWAEQIGADGYGKDATEALAVAKQLTGL
jgi:dimethylamine corrinoid protein